jgi:hypothetical protein
MHQLPFNPGRFMVLRAIVQLEGFGQLNNPAALSGIKAETCQLVAKWLCQKITV